MLEHLPNAPGCSAYEFSFRKFSTTEQKDTLVMSCIRCEPYTPKVRGHVYHMETDKDKQEITRQPATRTIPSNLAIPKIPNMYEPRNDLPISMQYRKLQSKCKTLQVKHSAIHSYGVFASQEYAQDEMIVEYVGEIIRQSVADVREKYYEEKNIGCYMFKIEDDMIVDATRKGNIARFVNHSCEPNAYAKIVNINGSKKIVIFAACVIRPREEITYDYKFQIEEEKIKCFCGAPTCRGFMN